MTTYFPISNTVPQYVLPTGAPYSGAVLKAYEDNTTTPIQMATDYTGATLVNTITLNAQGFPAVAGSVVVPHIAENYKLALYPDAASAAANTGAVWIVDDFQISSTASFGSLTDVPSASTISLNSTATNYFNITGTTTITEITLAEGVEVTVKFAGALTLTNGAFLILKGGANITTGAGDIAVFRGEAGGVVRMLDYVDVSMPAIVSASGSEKIVSTTISASVGTVEFINGTGGVVIDSTYRSYKLVLSGIRMTSDPADVSIQLRRSDTLAWVSPGGASNAPGIIANGSTSAIAYNSLDVADTLRGATCDMSAEILVMNLNAASSKVAISRATGLGSAAYNFHNMSHNFNYTQIMDGIRLSGSNNFTAGTIDLYGYK